ncbi:MAG: hypothetical protein L0H83_00380 [Salinisphaera sp.]|nr:hypothetical protein [Salinisphaera sp.]
MPQSPDAEIDDLLPPWKTDLAHRQKLSDLDLRAAIARDGVQRYVKREAGKTLVLEPPEGLARRPPSRIIRSASFPIQPEYRHEQEQGPEEAGEKATGKIAEGKTGGKKREESRQMSQLWSGACRVR